jgi:hypothetical protein
VDAGTTSPNDFAIMVKAGMVWDMILAMNRIELAQYVILQVYNHHFII